ncbi:MAG: DUF2828 family protein [Ruminococcaceae bacterium]|nr:DUF2828 family protein [Oscillospiraceae bacterium]
MLQYLKQESNKTFTENGAATLKTTQSDCLDLFATIGAIRRESDDEITARFMRAFAEDKDIAMKLLFFARDIRGGLGERRVFRIILKYLAQNEPEIIRKNLAHVAEYGRFDDLLVLFDTPVEKDMLDLIREQLCKDVEAMDNDGEVSLLGKWLPSVNASNSDTIKSAKKIARFLKMDDKAYRKMLSQLRAHIRIIENNLREKDYTFDYEKQPSKAMFKYRGAFARNDAERYKAFLSRVSDGKARLHTDTLMPYEIVAPFFNRKVSDDERRAIDTTWNSQRDFGGNENALVVIDGSGSMYGWGEPKPATVALSLGIYFAERNNGAFKNHFITFSENPQLVEIKGDDILDKLRYCCGYNEVANTNIQKVFELILNAAKLNKVAQNELPRRLYIVSDMEFDCCTKDASLTNFEYAKKIFEEAGYILPEVVFWNVASRNRQQPVTQNEQGVALVSGCTPAIFSMLAEGKLEDMTPYRIMLDVLGGERYERITA